MANSAFSQSGGGGGGGSQNLSSVLSLGNDNSSIAIIGDNFINASNVNATIVTDSNSGLPIFSTDSIGNALIEGHDGSSNLAYNMGFDNSGNYQITDPNGFIWITARNDSDVAIGDIDLNERGNFFQIQDSASIFTTSMFAGTAIYNIQDTGGKHFMQINLSAKKMLFGDIDSSGGLVAITMYSPVSLSKGADLNGFNITNVLNPVLAQDAATKSYVDSFLTGLQWKATVVVATTANITLSGEQTIDGVLTSTSRVLVKNQSTVTQNGIYVSASGSWNRSIDANTGAELVNATVAVTGGSTNANTAWVQTTPSPITIGSSNIVFAQFLNTVYSAGAGLALTSNVFSLDVTHGNTWTGLQQFNSAEFQLNGHNSGDVVISAAGTTTTYALFLPPAQGSLNDTLLNDGSGNLSWGPGGGGGGSTDAENYSLVASMRFLSAN